MPYRTLISAKQLHALQHSGQAVMVFDCSYNLADPAAGRQQFAQAHIPGARHADLHDHLSSHTPQRAASQGRHPLPLPEDFAATLRQWGFGRDMQAVVYDRNGCNFCGRLWWMLKWLGHDAVAILDGGLPAWQAAGYATESGADESATPLDASAALGDFAVQAPLADLVDTATVHRSLHDGSLLLIDARGAARYHGKCEPLDPIAGHIPGAINRPFSDNLQADGHFKPAAVLRQELAALLPASLTPAASAPTAAQAASSPDALPATPATSAANLPPANRTQAGNSVSAHTTSNAAPSPTPQAMPQTVVYCGSGVSAIATLLALELAGYPRPALYAGSWSAWSNTPGLPVERS
ncbi:MAG: sulfurtransferase [Brachymonas sp.]|nr:sulfurtransferase [Brachymonas sp.]